MDYFYKIMEDSDNYKQKKYYFLAVCVRLINKYILANNTNEDSIFFFIKLYLKKQKQLQKLTFLSVSLFFSKSSHTSFVFP